METKLTYSLFVDNQKYTGQADSKEPAYAVMEDWQEFKAKDLAAILARFWQYGVPRSRTACVHGTFHLHPEGNQISLSFGDGGGKGSMGRAILILMTSAGAEINKAIIAGPTAAAMEMKRIITDYPMKSWPSIFESLNWPTNDGYAESLWRFSTHGGIPACITGEIMRSCGYIPFSGFPLVRNGKIPSLSRKEVSYILTWIKAENNPGY